LVKDFERNEIFCWEAGRRGALHFLKSLLIIAGRVEIRIWNAECGKRE